MEYCTVITTYPDRKQAEAIASKIIETGIAACVQLSEIKSFYTWKGENRLNYPEIKMLIKTKTKLYDKLEQFIKENHSYQVPQIVKIPIEDGLEEYFDWIDDSTL